MGNNPSFFKKSGENRPVEQVSWLDVQGFLIRLNQVEQTKKYRLPTEAEWEYACRAGSTKSYCFGDDTTKLKDYAWYHEGLKWFLRSGGPQPVGQLKPNAWGFYDMHGNVWEWCQDVAGDPKEPFAENRRVVRGGSFVDSPKLLRSAKRYQAFVEDRKDDIGFRIAREL